MDKKRLHVVSFQFPLPANYGGVIDVYHKLKALREDGYTVVLHSFIYDRELDNAIYELVDELYLYERKRNKFDLFSLIPFIVRSRKNKTLLRDLCKDDDPILFEGLHCAYYMSHPALKGRVKFFRAHNIEHRYYYHLYKDSESVREKLFYLLESCKLKLYENVVHHASCILAISIYEYDYFKSNYPNVECYWLPCFYERDDLESEYVSRSYLLYHGNLSVVENRKAATYLIKEVLPNLNKQVKLVIAGANPSNELIHLLADKPNVTLEENPSNERMRQLIGEAKVNVLLTFQNTGVKLKLLNALHLGGHCVVNRKMVEGSGLEEFCYVAAVEEDLAHIINEVWNVQPLDNEHRNERRKKIKDLYANTRLTQSLNLYF